MRIVSFDFESIFTHLPEPGKVFEFSCIFSGSLFIVGTTYQKTWPNTP